MNQQHKITLYLGGVYKGQISVGEDSIVGRLIRGQDPSRPIQEMLEELNAIPGVKTSVTVSSSMSDLDEDQ
jgi:hypothetical protein